MNEADWHAALKSTAAMFPSSVVVDLMMNFDQPTVLRFLQVFGGRTFKVPTATSIWKNYRDSVVISTLATRDTQEVRKSLAKMFGVSLQVISSIASAKKPTKRRLPAAVQEQIADAIYSSERGKTLDDITLVLTKR